MVLGSQQNWAKGPKASHLSLLPHMYLSHYRYPLQMVHLLQLINLG